MDTLLPLNASATEKAVDQLATERLAIDLRPIDTNPMTCQENLLPWLAASWRIDISNLAIEEQRRLIAAAIEIHRYKGTVYAVQKALDAVFDDAQIVEFQKPFYFDARVTLKADQNAIYDAGKFSRARTLVNKAKNLRSRLGVFDVDLPDATLPLNQSAVAGVSVNLHSTLALKSRTQINLTGAMQWIL